jgi:hypothetical protein
MKRRAGLRPSNGTAIPVRRIIDVLPDTHTKTVELSLIAP